MTDDYISRTALLERIEAQRCDGRTGTCKDCDTKTFCVYGIVEAFPAAEVESVKHGEWYLHEGGKAAECSLCAHLERVRGRSLKKDEWRKYSPFCRSCGARMDGGVNHV